MQLNHTIVWCRHPGASARFATEVLGLPPPRVLYHFLVVDLENGVSLDYAEKDGAIAPQHYAFLVSEDEFDAILGRIRARKLPYWADPARSMPHAFNRHDGGRGLYFEDPEGHLLEILTRPCGG